MTVLATTNLPADTIKMRWKEPYVTAGLNQKTLVVLPKGIFTGFNPVSTGVGWGLELQVDSVLAFSGANVFETTITKYSITLVHPSNIALDLAAQANSTVYVCLDAQYAIGATSAAQVKVVDLAELALNPDLILLCKVNVPAVAPILASHINTGYRNHAGDTFTPESRPAFSLLSNGTFERDITGAAPLGWVPSDGGLVLVTDAAVFRTGAKSMRMTAAVAGVRDAITNPTPVVPSYKYKASAWMRAGGTPISGGTGVHAQVQFFNLNGTLLSTVDVEAPFTGGSTTFEQRALEVTAPANAANAKFRFFWDNAAGILYVDDVELSSRKTDTLPAGAGVDERYVLYGAPLGLINAFRVDGANATGAVAGFSWTFKAGDVSTVPLVAKNFTGSTQDIQQWQDGAGTALFKVSSAGVLGFSTDWSLFRQSANEVRLRNVDTFTFDRHFKFRADSFPVSPNGNTTFELVGDPILDTGHTSFKIALGQFSFADVRIGSETDIGIRIRQNATDTWLIANSTAGVGPYDIIAPTGAGVTNLRAPGGNITSGDFYFHEAARLSTVQASRGNLIVNGDMAIWQRFNTPGAISGTLGANSRVHLADRWYVCTGAGGATPYSRQPGPSTAFPYAIRFGRTAGNTSTAFRGLRQEIDREVWRSVLHASFGSTSLALSFWVRGGANFSGQFGMEPYALSASPGSDAAIHTNSFNGSWGGASNSPTSPYSTITPTGTWTRYCVSFNNIGGYAAALDFRYFPTGTAGADDWVEITGVHLVSAYGGGKDLNGVPFCLSSGSPGGEVEACQKYYEKSYQLNVAPGNFVDDRGVHKMAYSTTTVSWAPDVKFKTRKMPHAASYAFQTWSPASGVAGLAFSTASGDISLDSPNDYGETGFVIDKDVAAANGEHATVHWVVDVEM